MLFFASDITDGGETKTMSVKFDRPEGEDQSWVFCSTQDAFLSYQINWGEWY